MNFKSFTKSGKFLIDSSQELISEIKQIDQDSNTPTLFLITPDKVAGKIKPSIWIDIHNAWASIIGKKKSIDNWRIIKKFGDEVIPGLRIFKLKGSKDNDHFILLSKTDPIEAIGEINNIFSRK